VSAPSLTNFGGPLRADAGEFDATFSDLPSAFSTAILPAATLLSAFG
jgi:hypothetical protein